MILYGQLYFDEEDRMKRFGQVLFFCFVFAAMIGLPVLYSEDSGETVEKERNPGGFTILGASAELTVNSSYQTNPSIRFMHNGYLHWFFKNYYDTEELCLGSTLNSEMVKFGKSGRIDVLASIFLNQGGTSPTLTIDGNSYRPVDVRSDYSIAGEAVYAALTNAASPYYSGALTGENSGTGYGVVGKGLGASASGVFGQYSTASNYGILGSLHYGVSAELNSTTAGDYAVYGDGTDATGEDGSGYGFYTSLGGVKGYNFYGNPYTFGVAGYSDLDYNRSGGVIGAFSTGVTIGILGYRDSGGNYYGGYFSSYTTGSGKDGEPQQVISGVGIGVNADLLGGYIKGQNYGLYVQGERYAQYVSGDSYTEGYPAVITENENGLRTVTYATTAPAAEIHTSGIARLNRGRATVEFESAFVEIVSDTEPVIVTVTPIGRGAQLYLEESDAGGFIIADDMDSESDIQFTWIAVGKRKGSENHQPPREIMDPNYRTRMEQVTHNEADVSQDSLGIYLQNGSLEFGPPPVTHTKSEPPPNR